MGVRHHSAEHPTFISLACSIFRGGQGSQLFLVAKYNCYSLAVITGVQFTKEPTTAGRCLDCTKYRMFKMDLVFAQ